MLKRLLLALFLVLAPVAAQETARLFYDGSGNITYRCSALSQSTATTFARSDSTLTSVVVLTNVGTVTTVADHGLAIGNLVTISGATVDTDLNGDHYIATVPSAKTFTIATSSVANATYNEATLALATTAPRGSQNVWSIQKFTVSGSNITVTQWAGNASRSYVCDNRAVTTGATKVLYQ